MRIRARGSHGIRINYANVTATLALFISLGGASYAAVSLPAHSVGPTQLKPSAVGVAALGFPLGASSVTNESPQDLSKGACNGALRPGETPPPCAPSHFGGPSPTQLRIHTHHHGKLLVSAVAGLDNEGAPGTHAEVSYAVILDERAISHGEITVAGGQQEHIPIQALLPVASGPHMVGIQLGAEYSGYGPGDVIISPVSLIALSLP
jgi:hypothetical protein